MVIPPRYVAPVVHVGLSLLILGVLYALARWLWYPSAYFAIAGVDEVLLVLLIVSVLLGPLLTFLVLGHQRSQREVPGLGFDLIAIAVVQGAALGYGAWALAASRPALTVFDDGFFRVRSMAVVREIVQEPLKAEDGPAVVWARPERETSASGSRAGEAGSTHYEKLQHAKEALANSGRSVAELAKRDARVRDEVKKLLPEGKDVPENWRIYPVYGRRDGWSAVVDADDASVVGFVHAHSHWVREGGKARAVAPPQEVATAGDRSR